MDTNVAITANRRDGGTYACANACAKRLLEIKRRGKLVLDNQNEILSEYRSYLNHSGQPGVGDAFFRWFFNNRGKRDLCCEVAITPISHQWRIYEEFPADNALSDFDKSDQKFVAASQGHPEKPPILQATDHKWLKWSDALAVHGTSVSFLCEREVRETAARRMHNI
ncbi:MAG: hypothetical protein ACYCOU_24100 [Sulfobacillus sp.]